MVIQSEVAISWRKHEEAGSGSYRKSGQRSGRKKTQLAYRRPVNRRSEAETVKAAKTRKRES